MDIGKRKVVLAFPDLKTLIDFETEVDINNCEIVRTRSLLICELAEADIQVAIRHFKATEIV